MIGDVLFFLALACLGGLRQPSSRLHPWGEPPIGSRNEKCGIESYTPK